LRGTLLAYGIVAVLCSAAVWVAAVRRSNRTVLDANETAAVAAARTLAARIASTADRKTHERALAAWVEKQKGRQAHLLSLAPLGAPDAGRPQTRTVRLLATSGTALTPGELTAESTAPPNRTTGKAIYDWAVKTAQTRKPVVRWRSHPDKTERVGAGMRIRQKTHPAKHVRSSVLLVRLPPPIASYTPPVWAWLLLILLPGLALFLWLWRTQNAHRWTACAVAAALCWLGCCSWLGGVTAATAQLQRELGLFEFFGRGLVCLAAGGTPFGVALLTFLLTAGVMALGWSRLGGRLGAALKQHRVAYLYVLPAAAGMVVLVLIPFIVGLALGFFNHCEGSFSFVGVQNFTDILSGGGAPLTHPLNFYFTLGVTILWTSLNVFLHVAIGLAIALVLRDPLLKGKGIYRVLLIIPWAVPNYITALMWKGMFHQQYGAVNLFLKLLGIPAVSWFSSFWTAFSANVITNTWLGFPFMMVVCLGALQSIPQDLYEAAEVDGAGRLATFTHITLPLIRPALLPAVILGSIWTFNMFNIIYLVSGGEPAGSTDILITEAYRWAFIRYERYGLAAAYATLIFIILLGYTYLTNRVSRSAKG
jgi:ABC-type sugar transport system permease subunit